MSPHEQSAPATPAKRTPVAYSTLHGQTSSVPGKSLDSYLSRVIAASLIACVSLILLGVYVFYIYRSDGSMLSGVGQIIAATVTSITLIFIALSQYTQIVQIKSQAIAIDLQREELELQRLSQEHSVKSISAQIYIDVINDAKKTLSRYCRSLIILYNRSAQEKIDTVTHSDPDFLTEMIAESSNMSSFIAQHHNEPMVRLLIGSYCTLYEKIQNYAITNQGLFSLTMENSSYQHVYTMLITELGSKSPK